MISRMVLKATFQVGGLTCEQTSPRGSCWKNQPAWVPYGLAVTSGWMGPPDKPQPPAPALLGQPGLTSLPGVETWFPREK